MPPTVQTGTVLASTVAAQKIPVDMDAEILFEETSANRYEYYTRKLRAAQECGNMKKEWMEAALYPNVLICTGAGTTTTIPVDHPEYAHRDQLLFNTRTLEMYIMNEDIGGTGTGGSITVVNHSGSGNITTATQAGDVLIVLPEAHAEGEAVPPAFSSKPDFFYTYLMQSDETLKYSDIAKNQEEYGLAQYLADLKQMWIYRKRGINLALLVNRQMRETASASVRRHTSQGLMHALTSNKVDCSFVAGVFNLTFIGELLRVTKRHGASSSVKIGIAGQNPMVSLSAIPVSAIQTTVSEQAWGKRLTSLRTPFGDLSFDHDASLSDEFGLADVFIILDPKCPHRLYMRGLPERMITDLYGTTDLHNTTSVFTGTWGQAVKQQFLSAWVYGIK